MTDSPASRPPDGTVELHAGALRLALRADLGGCIAGLWHHHVPVLLSAEPHALASARPSGCFPMLPYANRLGYRRFRWEHQDHTTLPNFEGSPHSLHGVGWQRPWEIVSVASVEAVLRYRHAADGHWPFDFEATQFFSLTPQHLHLSLQLTNTGGQTQPVGLGWHPYFPRRARSRLHIEVAQRWESDATQLPVRQVAQPGIDADVAHLAFDHCFDGWRGAARIRDEKFSLQLTSSCTRLVVFTPTDRDFFCVEPVSHVTNAIHMADPLAHGLVALAPGETASAEMMLKVAPL